MRKVGAWILAAVIALGLLALWLWCRSRGDKTSANGVMADTIDAWHTPRIDAARTRAEDLRAQFGGDNAIARDAQKEVNKLKATLAEKYRDLELTPEEMEARFRNLRV